MNSELLCRLCLSSDQDISLLAEYQNQQTYYEVASNIFNIEVFKLMN